MWSYICTCKRSLSGGLGIQILSPYLWRVMILDGHNYSWYSRLWCHFVYRLDFSVSCHPILICQNTDPSYASRSRIEWKSLCGSYHSKFISYFRAQKLINGGCLSYLAFIRDTSVDLPSIESVPMVREFMGVFPTNLPRFPPARELT